MDARFVRAVRGLRHEIDARGMVKLGELPARKRKLADAAIRFGYIHAQPSHGDFVLIIERRA